MTRIGHIPRFFALLFLSFLFVGCEDGIIMAPTATQPDVKPTEAVVQSVAKIWSGARITSAERIYTLGFNPQYWGDYRLTVDIPESPTVLNPIFRADGTLRWYGGSLEDPSKEPSGKGSFVLRDREY